MRNLLKLMQVIGKWSKGIRHSRKLIVLAVVTSFLAGVGYTMLIALIKRAVGDGLTGAAPSGLTWTFVAFCLAIPFCGFASQMVLLYLTSQGAYELRIQLSRQILAAPLRQLEKLGTHRLLATITQDIGSVIELVNILPQMLTQLAMMIGCIVYLGWLSWKLLLIMLACMAVGLLTHQLPMSRAFRYFRLLREQWDAMYKGFQGVIMGTKELKLNSKRREAFLAQELEPAAAGLRDYGIRGNAISMAVSNWGQILFFIFIGLLLFAGPALINIQPQVLIGYTLVVLFMITPLTMLLNQIPALERAYLAAERIEELGLSLTAAKPESLAASSSPDAKWRRLDLVNVTHSYRQDGAPAEFQLGPINLTFYPGELVFLVGGNGSGKTTLVKLLMGLYEPDAGEIRVNDKTVTPNERDDYRQQFSAVFFDFYLFERLFGFESQEIDAESQKYLELLQLSHKLTIKNGQLSTIDLSQGQRKRVALLNAYLEDRPIYIFDEWAADQDPQFKQIFYYELVPELKNRGKTVIVISHDDRYYGLADRLIKLESGKVEYDEPVVHPEPLITAAATPVM
ncbi:MAG TPA: cyclic peptide export ABC transporter [Pyrinomonadaceae bacterium]|nr:cyclic peptide export ABC transporter [Pyrinomonadaceae bacterium]